MHPADHDEHAVVGDALAGQHDQPIQHVRRQGERLQIEAKLDRCRLLVEVPASGSLRVDETLLNLPVVDWDASGRGVAVGVAGYNRCVVVGKFSHRNPLRRALFARAVNVCERRAVGAQAFPDT
jgi:hypothetical protein